MKYLKKILDNGLTVVMVPQKNTRQIALGFFVMAGSRNENNRNHGIAHFLEHMLFKGTTHRKGSEINAEVDMLGAYYNAYTTHEHTYYFISGDAEDTKKLLDIILDIYINPNFDTKEMTKERKVVIEEMRMYEDTPTTKLYNVMHAKLFNSTSLSRSIIGTEETIMSIRRKDFIDFYTTFYRPNNTIFVVAGNFNPVPIYRIIRKVLTPLKNPAVDVPNYLDEAKIILKNMRDQDQPYVYIKRNIRYKQVYLMLVFPIYDMFKTKSQEIGFLSRLLTWGHSSRIYSSLREKHGISYGSSTYPVAYSDVGLYVIQSIMNPIEFITGLKIILRELKRLKEELITTSEMKKLQKYAHNEAAFSMGPLDTLIHFGLSFLYDRDFKPSFEIDDQYSKITRVQIQKLAREIFVRDKINLFIYGNVDIIDFEFIDL